MVELLKSKGYKQPQNGFYIDIGAGLPITGSNTYTLYRMGWQGVCIDANSFNIKLHKFFRPRDTALNVFIGDAKMVTFWLFKPYEYSTGSDIISAALLKANVPLISKSQIKSIPLNSIEEIYKSNYYWSFLSIDTEGYDLEILKGIDWDKFRPKFICCENFSHRPSPTNLTEVYSSETKDGLVQNDPIYDYLTSLGYERMALAHVSEIWYLND